MEKVFDQTLSYKVKMRRNKNVDKFFLSVSGFYFLQFASQPFFSTRCRKTRVLNFLFSFTRVIELETFYEFKMMKFFSPYYIQKSLIFR